MYVYVFVDVKRDWLKSAHDFKGKVLHCLREQYSETQVRLSTQCRDKVRYMIRDSAYRFHLDPVLRDHW